MYAFDNFYLDCIVKLGAAFLCGLLLGLERKRRFHSVGMRTLILISVSSMLLGIISYTMADLGVVKGDPTRIAAGVVTGIGFIGGGAIMHLGMNIKGLTSAAIIWAACAMGLACGIGAYFIVAITLIVSLLSLVLLGIAESLLFPAEKTKCLTIVYSEVIVDIMKIEQLIEDANFVQRDMDITTSLENNETVLRFIVKIPKTYNLLFLTSDLKKLGSLKKLALTDS